MKQDHELAGIEVLRFMSAFAVLIWHYQHFFYSGVPEEAVLAQARDSLPLHTLFLPAYKYGYWAVQVFWLISGFIFYRQYADTVSNRSIGFLDFVLRRFSRLYPLHLVTLLIVAVGQEIYLSSHESAFIYQNNDGVSFAYQLLFASNWFPHQVTSFNGPIWSISSEILVYVAFFGIVRVFGPNFLVAFLAWAMSCIIFDKGLADNFFNSDIANCAIFFFAGGVTQRLCKYRYTVWLAGCAGLITLVLLMVHLCHVNTQSMLALAISAVVLLSSLDVAGVNSVARRVSFLGNATYSSYLIHFPLQLAIVIVVDRLNLSRSLFFHPIVLVGFLALVIGASLVVYYWFERPMQDWIRNNFRQMTKSAPRPR